MPRATAREVVLALGCLAAAAGSVRAQVLPADPIALADGRLTISGDVAASYGSADPGFFDYTDYDHSALRLLRINVAATLKASEHFAVLGDIQTENLEEPRPYALYLRIRPWTDRAFDIQVGRVPPTFGAFGRRTYVSDNPLIGYPLAYQYLTSLRADALPANADELLQKRSFGWLVRYSVGEPGLSHGVPLVNAFRWDTGAQVHGAFLHDGAVSVTASITTGTVSNPLFDDDNGGKQVAARVETKPAPGLVAGASFARGDFVSDTARRAATAASRDDLTQTAWGADVEYSRDYYLVRAEAIVSHWRLPAVGWPRLDDPLRASSLSVEGRYKIRPGLYAAARAGHRGFSEVAGSSVTAPWDAPVTRYEVGGGYSIQRNLLVKAAYQRNRRDGGRLRSLANQVATQVVFWF
jgi:hypothetical protein